MYFPTHLLTFYAINSLLHNGADTVTTLAGSSLAHPLNYSSSTTPFQNGHFSPLADNMSDSDKIHPSSESDLSNTEQPSRPSNLYRAQSNQASTPASRATGSPLTDTASDQDADGDEDGDYDIETPPITATTAPAEELSPSSSSARVSKRKMSATEDEYMRENPELYGLRRSVDISYCSTLFRANLSS